MFIGSLNKEYGKKQWVQIDKTTTLDVHHAFCKFLCRSCTTTTWKCLRFHVLSRTWTKDNKLAFPFPELVFQPFRIQQQQKRANIWRIKRDGISAIKFEATRICQEICERGRKKLPRILREQIQLYSINTNSNSFHSSPINPGCNPK